MVSLLIFNPDRDGLEIETKKECASSQSIKTNAQAMTMSVGWSNPNIVSLIVLSPECMVCLHGHSLDKVPIFSFSFPHPRPPICSFTTLLDRKWHCHPPGYSNIQIGLDSSLSITPIRFTSKTWQFYLASIFWIHAFVSITASIILQLKIKISLGRFGGSVG